MNLDSDVVDKTLGYIETSAKGLHDSMRPALELESLNAVVVRLGRQAGVPTPVKRLLYSILAVHKDGAAT